MCVSVRRGSNYQILVRDRQDFAGGWQVIGGKNFSPNRPPAMSLIHSAAALIYSALALAETFVLLAVVLGLFWLVARTILRIRKD
jgi:hypothetical protein